MEKIRHRNVKVFAESGRIERLCAMLDILHEWHAEKKMKAPHDYIHPCTLGVTINSVTDHKGTLEVVLRSGKNRATEEEIQAIADAWGHEKINEYCVMVCFFGDDCLSFRNGFWRITGQGYMEPTPNYKD